MKKLLLCSALAFGVWSESHASLWEIEAFTNDKETGVTSKTSLVAITERMNKLNSVSTVDAKRIYRWLYDYWLSDSKKWSNDGKKSTFGNILGYCNQDYIVETKDKATTKDWTSNFNLMLKKIEDLLPEAAANNGDDEIEKKKTQEEIDQDAAAAAAQVIRAENLKTDKENEAKWSYTFKTSGGYIETDEDKNPILTDEAKKRIESELLAQKQAAEVASQTEQQTQESAIDAADNLKKSKKIQRNKLEEAVNAMEKTVYEGTSIADIDTTFDLTDLATVFGKAGVDVDEDFMVSLKRAWSMQALDMSDAARLGRYGSYDIDVEDGADPVPGGHYVPNGYKLNNTTAHLMMDEQFDPNTFENGDNAGHAALFLLNHFRDTDTRQTSTGEKWDFRSIKGNDLDTLKGDDGAALLKKLFDEYATKKSGSLTDPKEIAKEKMTFHLNLVARLLSEMAKEKDLVIDKTTGEPRIEEYRVEGIIFHAFRQYMLQSFREAILLIKNS